MPGVGARQQRVHGRAIARIEGDADARRDMHIDAEQPHRRPHHIDGALADADGLCTCHRSIDQDHEFIASEAGRGVDRAHRTLEALRHLTQEIIAGAVAEGVVDELEAVEIHHQQPELVSLTVRLRDRLGDAIIEQQAVREPGECVV
jgi:hypothetical protein